MGYTVGEASCSQRPQVASSSQASRKTTMTATLRKTGSIGNLRTAMTPTGSPLKHPSRTRGICNCQQQLEHNQTAQLQEQYMRNLQQQIYFLELENSYLRHGGKQEKNDDDEISEESPKRNALPPPKSPIDGYEDIQERQEKDTHKRTHSSTVNGTGSPARRKPVESLETHDLRPHLMVGQAEMLQKLEEAYQRELRTEERLKQKVKEHRLLEEENNVLLNRIRDVEASRTKADENYTRDKRALMEEIVELQRRLDDLTPNLAQKESHIARLESEKDAINNKLRIATSQLNNLQIKTDERKREEVALTNLEMERRTEIERLTKNIRKLENEIAEHREKERSLIDDVASTRRSLREEQLRAKKDKALAEKALEENNALIKENSQLSAQISRLEMDVESLKRENSERRASEVSAAELAEMREIEKSLRVELLRAQEKTRTEQEKIRHAESQLEEYRNAEEEVKEARLRMQKELDALQALSKSLSAENKALRQDKLELNERCEELLRKGNLLASDISSLTRNVESLTKKNSTLQEKIESKESEICSLKKEVNSLADKNRELQQKLNEKEEDLLSSKQKCETIDRQYRQILVQLERETTLQQEKSNEYEQLANKVRELSASISRSRAQSVSDRSSRLPVSQEFLNDVKTDPVVEMPSGTSSTSTLRHKAERKSNFEKSTSRVSYVEKS